MPAYPAIPLPNTSFRSRVTVPVERTNMEGGLPRQRAKFAAGATAFNVDWTLTEAELALFKTFFHTTLVNGTLFFDMEVPTEDGVETRSVRFVGGDYDEVYVPHGHWNVSAQLELETIQDVASPDTPLEPIWHRDERNILIDTDVPANWANDLLICAPDTGQTIVLTMPEVITPSDWLPIGVLNKGPGNVLIRIDEDPIIVDPALTWMQLASDLGAWGIYRFDTGVGYESGTVRTLADLSPNAHDLGDYSGSKYGSVVGGWLRCDATAGTAFLGTPIRDGGILGSPAYVMNEPTYSVLLICRFHNLAAPTGAIFTTEYEDFGALNRTGVFLAASPAWSLFRASSAGTNSSDYLVPLTGTAPRLLEFAQLGANDDGFFNINGQNGGGWGSGTSQNLKRLQFGGWGTLTGSGVKNFVANVEIAAAVVFAGSTTLNVYRDMALQQQMALLRKMMLDDY